MAKPYIRYDFSKRSLYDLVWRKPAAQIERELQIQVKTLKAICIDFEIPRPSSRYWTGLRMGKEYPRDIMPCNKLSETQNISIKIRNPDYCSEIEDRNRMRAYVQVKAEAAREREREEFVRKLIDRADKISKFEDQILKYLKPSTEKQIENYQSMILWVKRWLDKERAAIDPQMINQELGTSKLFEATEVAFDFNDETFESSYLSEGEHEYLVTCWLSKFEEEEEVIKL